MFKGIVKRLGKVICISAGAMLILTGCGKDAESTNSGDVSQKESGTEAVIPAVPSGVSITRDGENLVLSWTGDENAKGYRIYQGSGRFSNDYEEVNDKLIEGNTYVIEGAGYDYYKIAGVNGDKESELSEAVSMEQEIFGENVYIYSPADDPKEVNQELFSMYLKQETAQFDNRRYAVMFKPGEYSEEIEVNVGFYMDVMGLGQTPVETTLQKFQCTAQWLGDDSNHNATCNFWRGVSNLQINSDVMWAVSQATFMRRMQINGNLALHDNYGWSSGGFLSDSVITGQVDSGSQQQWLSRNCDWKVWAGENWNMVFVGIEEGKAPTKTWPVAAYTAVDKTPVVSEKPFLFYEDGSYKVFVPELTTETEGITWQNGVSGSSISLDEFYVAQAKTDTAATMNEALAQGKHLLLTPGIYKLEEALQISNPETIVLGIGYATLESTNGNACMTVADEEGIRIAGLLFETGETESQTLLQVGEEKNETSHSENPIVLSDMFFRVGGAYKNPTATKSCVVINSNNVIGDNFWVWRADHGDGVAWDTNTAPNGIIVNGDDVTIYALMVEHFQEYQTIWNGERGSVYFYQSELPYDVPNQSEWQSHDGKMNGYASYYVNENVSEHTSYGIGIYSFNRDAIVEEYCAMEVPEADGMNLHNVCSVMITGNPGVSHVINSYGSPAYSAGTRSTVIDFQKERARAAKNQ